MAYFLAVLAILAVCGTGDVLAVTDEEFRAVLDRLDTVERRLVAMENKGIILLIIAKQ